MKAGWSTCRNSTKGLYSVEAMRGFSCSQIYSGKTARVLISQGGQSHPSGLVTSTRYHIHDAVGRGGPEEVDFGDFP